MNNKAEVKKMNKLMNVLLIAAFALSAVCLAACAFGQPTVANNNQAVNAGDKTISTADKGESEAENLAKTIKVTVSSNGFAPESIEVKKGQPVKLAFFRADADNCGGEVVFPKMNIKKELPIGKTVLVAFTPQESGKLAFTCGMNMMRGKIVVTD